MFGIKLANCVKGSGGKLKPIFANGLRQIHTSFRLRPLLVYCLLVFDRLLIRRWIHFGADENMNGPIILLMHSGTVF
jgi:hypothetical protein